MKTKIFKGGLVLLIVTLFLGCNQKKEAPMATTTVDKEAIKTEIQAMEDAYAAAYNAIKADLATFPKGAKISFETKEVHVSNDGNQVVEIGGYAVTDSTNTKMRTGNFMSLFEKRDG